MNPLLHWLTSPEWAHVVVALLHSLWQGALVALVLALLMRRLTNPLTRYRCALSALGVIVISGLITWGMLNAPKTAPNPIPPAANDLVTAPVIPEGFSPNPGNKIVVVAPMTQPEAQPNWTTWLAMLWMTGAVIMLLRAGVKVAGAEKLRRSCQPLADESIAALVTEACRAVGLARKIRVAVTDKLTSPAVVGVLVPTLILPLSLFTTLTPTQIQFVLLHELAHIRRGDYLANLFQLFAEALLFFNPAVWWISHQIRREREACCDALAIELSGAPADYASTLVRVAENILQPAPAAAPAFGDDGREPSSLADRVQRLVVPGYRPALRLTWRAMLTSLLVGVALLVFSALGTRNTVGAILSSTQSSTNILGMPLNEPAPITTNEEADSVSDEISDGRRWRESKAELLQLIQHVTNGSKIINTADRSLSLEDIPPLSPLLSTAQNRTYYHGDDSTFQTTNIPALTKFVGYDLATAATFVPTLITGTGQSIDSVLPLPIFRVRQLITSNNLGDGQTNVLGGLYSDNVAKIKDKVPFLDDLLAGRLDTNLFHLISISTNDIADREARYADEKTRLDQQWFWHRGNETASASKVGTTNNPTEPLYRRVFQIDLNRFYAAVRKSAGLPEAVTGTNLFPAIRSFFTNAGVNLDPAFGRGYFLSHSRGDLVIRATIPELDAVEALLQPLKGMPLVVQTYLLAPDAFAKVGGALPFEINSIFATNSATGLRALLESFDRNDPRPKHVYYNAENNTIRVRATAADLERFEAVLKDAIKIKTGAITQPPASESSLALNLTTRTFQVEPTTIAKAIEATVPEFKAGAATNVTAGLRALFETAGVDLALPKSMFFNDRAGGLFVRATKEDLDTIESLLQVIGQQPAQVNIKAVFVEIPVGKDQPKALAGILARVTPENGTNFTGILTAPQFKLILRALETNAAARILADPQVTTLSGRQAQMQVADVKTIVSGMIAVVTNGMTNLVYQSQAMQFGPVLDVLPTVSSDGYTIQMTIIPTITEFLGYEDAKKLKLPSPDDKGTLPLPVLRKRQITTSASVWDGQTIVLGNFSDQMLDAPSDLKVTPKASGKKQSKQLLVFVTPTIIDPAGNPANKDMGIPSRLLGR